MMGCGMSKYDMIWYLMHMGASGSSWVARYLKIGEISKGSVIFKDIFWGFGMTHISLEISNQ